jgi:hypothetical protein
MREKGYFQVHGKEQRKEEGRIENVKQEIDAVHGTTTRRGSFFLAYHSSF